MVPLPLSDDGSGPLLRLYVCGITPYDTGHMGHASTYCAFDVLIRLVEATGARVRYVQNVTDVDDPLFERARRNGTDWKQLAEREQASFVASMEALGWRPPDEMPRVSDEIASITKAVEGLADRGFAYQTDAVYFDVERYPSYGALSHRSHRSMVRKLRDEGLLGTVGPGHKKGALDFPLWRPSAADEPAWDSRFGPGRPGWHIECSAMAMRHLGAQIEVHGGGRDLAFSHHESERAQSESLTGVVPFVGAWMHCGMVRYEGRKMSKSLGNLVVVNQALERAPAAAVRLYLASHHYRRDWDFEWSGLERMVSLTKRLRKLLGDGRLGAGAGPGGGPPAGASADLTAAFLDALARDLDTPLAIRVLRKAVRQGDAAAAGWMLGFLAGDAPLT